MFFFIVYKADSALLVVLQDGSYSIHITWILTIIDMNRKQKVGITKSTPLGSINSKKLFRCHPDVNPNVSD